MTECNPINELPKLLSLERREATSLGEPQSRQPLKRLQRHAVAFDFKGGAMTSDGGLLLLREVERRLQLISRIDQIIPDPRDPRYIVHPQAELLTSRIFAIAAGYEDGNDHQHLRHDVAFQVAAGHTPTEKHDDEDASPLGSPSTLSRLENRVAAKTCLRLHEVFVDVFIESFEEPPEEIILDFDATDDLVHGEQEQSYFNGFYDGHCFLPLYVFCGDHLLVSYLRPGNVGAAHHARGVTKLLVNKIRSHWPHVRIILRGDSGFSNERLMRWCDKNNVGYVFGFQKNPVLERHLACEMTRAKILHACHGGSQCCFAWFRYKADSWDRHRWIVGKAEFSEQGANPRFVVTNLPSSEGIVDPIYHRPRIDGKQVRCVKDPGTPCSPALHPETFYRSRYCPRGEMENRIKENQLYLFADRTSCPDFEANQFRLLLSSFAYVLLDGVRRLGLKGTKQARWRVDTIRLRLLKIAARVRVTCRRVMFHLASYCPFAEVFEAVMVRLCRSD